MEFYNKKNIQKNNIEDIYKGKYETLYLFGADELEFDKIPKKTFIIYHGHHGDKAASRADLIIPMPSFTEKEGIYVNLEGRAQISRQVKMPIANVEHSSIFFSKLASSLGFQSDYSDLGGLREIMFNRYPNLSKINQFKSEKSLKPTAFSKKFSKNVIISNVPNFYMTDSVSRNSPTMSSCSLQINENQNKL